MRKFKHHSCFAKEKSLQRFRHPFVCFTCRKSFKQPISASPRICPQCQAPMVMVSRKFSAPKSRDLAQWEKVKFLVDHGFLFYSLRQQTEAGGLECVPYPANLDEAKAFVRRYQPFC